MMQPNPVLKKLGLADDARAVIIHADDIGMCQSSVTAYADLVDFGLLTSAATMVPCAWFPAVAEFCRQHPDADMGVHLTLTSEWNVYRWGPLSTRQSASGLLDEEGYFPRKSEAVQQSATPAAVAVEWEAQIERALTAGIEPTHFDTHMLSAYHQPYLGAYTDLARQYKLPPMLLRETVSVSALELYSQPESAAYAQDQVDTLEAENVPLVDYFDSMSLEWDDSKNRMDEAKQRFASLQPGITHFVLHPTHDTPEIRAIAPDWRCRVSDFELFSSRELQTYIHDQGVQVINYRMLRDVLRGETKAASTSRS